MSDSEADKKRNKLGYQRISIACAHCRRRKIRCLLAEKDPQGRCQNCIRLKKECIFYPIDQQGAYESRSDHSSHHGVGSASSSGVSSTSPDVQTAHMHGAGQAHYTPQNTSHAFQGVPLESHAIFQGSYLPVDRPYHENVPSHSPWPPPVSRGYELPAHGHVVSPDNPQNPQFWAYDQSPGSGDFAPFPNEAAQQVRTPSTPFSASFVHPSSPERQWQLQQPHQSTRSMTYPLPTTSMAISLPQSLPGYVGEFTRQTPPASYPPFSVPQESPQMMVQMQGPPFSTPISQSQSFPQYGVQYHRGPDEHQHGALPVQQGYPMGWDPSSNALGFSLDEQHSIPSTRPPPYVVPSQRPR